MSSPDDLKRQFAALRDEDAGEAPSFAVTLAAIRARQEPRDSAPWAWTALLGGAVMIAIFATALRLAGPTTSTRGEAVQSVGTVDQWVAPTDDLLASADLLAPSETMLDELAFFSSPTADLIDLNNGLTTRTP